MIEPAIYVLIGVFATALVAMIAIPAISRRAFRLAAAQLSFLAPPSAAEASAARDALRARFATEILRYEQLAAAAGESATRAQMEAGRRAATIAARDATIAERLNDIASLSREIDALQTQLRDRDAEIGAREIALHDFMRQRDAAEAQVVDARRRLAEQEAEAERARILVAAEIERERAVMTAQAERDRAVIAAQQSQIAALTIESVGPPREKRPAAPEVIEVVAKLPVAATPRAPSLRDIPAVARLLELVHAPAVARWFAPVLERTRNFGVSALPVVMSVAEPAPETLQPAELVEAWRIADRRAKAVLDGDYALRQTIARLGRDLSTAAFPPPPPRQDAAILAFRSREFAPVPAPEERREPAASRVSEG